MAPEAVIGCRPVVLDPTDPLQAEIMNLTFVYTGSVKANCDTCNRRVWVGPKQQAHLRAHPDSLTMCFLCVADAGAGQGFSTVRSLGNEEPNPNA